MGEHEEMTYTDYPAGAYAIFECQIHECDENHTYCPDRCRRYIQIFSGVKFVEGKGWNYVDFLGAWAYAHHGTNWGYSVHFCPTLDSALVYIYKRLKRDTRLTWEDKERWL